MTGMEWFLYGEGPDKSRVSRLEKDKRGGTIQTSMQL